MKLPVDDMSEPIQMQPLKEALLAQVLTVEAIPLSVAIPNKSNVVRFKIEGDDVFLKLKWDAWILDWQFDEILSWIMDFWIHFDISSLSLISKGSSTVTIIVKW